MKEFAFDIITGFFGNVEITFFKVGFQKPRWSLSKASRSFILLEHVGSGYLGNKTVSLYACT